MEMVVSFDVPAAEEPELAGAEKVKLFHWTLPMVSWPMMLKISETARWLAMRLSAMVDFGIGLGQEY